MDKRVKFDFEIDFTNGDGKIVSQLEFWPEPFEAAAWRAQWIERMA